MARVPLPVFSTRPFQEPATRIREEVALCKDAFAEKSDGKERKDMNSSKWWNRLLLTVGVVALSVSLAQGEMETVDGVEWTFTIADGKATVGGGSSSSLAVSKATTGAITCKCPRCPW